MTDVALIVTDAPMTGQTAAIIVVSAGMIGASIEETVTYLAATTRDSEVNGVGSDATAIATIAEKDATTAAINGAESEDRSNSDMSLHVRRLATRRWNYGSVLTLIRTARSTSSLCIFAVRQQPLYKRPSCGRQAPRNFG